MATMADRSIASSSWMEHSILEHVKQALRVTLDWKAPIVSMPRKLSSLQFTLRSFRRHLDRVMTIEEEGGYMSELADLQPNLQSRIDALSGDHNRFRVRVDRLVHELDDVHGWEEERFDRLCAQIRDLLDEVDRHDAVEIDLLQESLLIDVGGEG